MNASLSAVLAPFPPQLDVEGWLRRLEAKFNTDARTDSAQASNSLSVEEARRILGPGVQVLKAIGHGATASVFIVLTEMGIFQAYKIARVDRAAQLEAIKQVVDLLWSSDCPGHLLGINAFGFCQNRNYFYIATPLLDNTVPGFSPATYKPRTLLSWLQTRPRRGNRALNPADALTLVGHLLAILDGLAFLHANNLCANDVHPGNFGFREQRMVLVDFSSITGIGEKPHEGALWYAAPEGREATPAHDCYAVVKILVEGLWDLCPSGIQPMEIEQICQQHCDGLLDRLVSAIASRGLSMELQDRYQQADELIRDLQELQKLLASD